MSVTFVAKAIIGLRVPTDMLIRRVRVRAFDHDYPEDWRLCPKTAKTLWTEEDRWVFPELSKGEASYPEEATFAGYPLRVHPNHWRGHNRHLYVALEDLKLSGYDEDESGVNLPDSYRLGKFQADMTEAGIMDPLLMGFWLVLGAT